MVQLQTLAYEPQGRGLIIKNQYILPAVLQHLLIKGVGRTRRLPFSSLALENHSVIEEAELLAPLIYLTSSTWNVLCGCSVERAAQFVAKKNLIQDRGFS